MANVKVTLDELMKIDGALAAAIVDTESGMSLGDAGGSATLNLDVAAAGNSEVVKSKLKVMNNLGIKGFIHDILITLDDQYHLIRPLSSAKTLFIYLVLNKSNSNLAMARHKLATIEKELEI
ncbi:hypothetical protein EON83_17545 [bacterium]|nr:MAG: hypothetical protein EON83_17545 [bacterium]